MGENVAIVIRRGITRKSVLKGKRRTVASDDYDSADILVVSSSDFGGEWVLDSSCSFHTTPNRSCFQEFQQTEGVMVLLRNNKS